MKRFLPFLSLVLCGAYTTHGQTASDYFGAGRINGVQVSSSSQAQNTNHQSTINGAGMDAHLKDASRFLGQATMGYDYDDIQSASESGFDTWIDNQVALPLMSFKDTTEMVWNHFMQAYFDTWGEDEVVNSGGVFPLSIYYRMGWWNNTMKGDDQLRQRMAFALSEIFVISEKSQLELSALGLADYYDKLYQNAFGNFRDLLEAVTLHPSMGFYLSHLNNERSNPDENIRPDENYAREVMQLFTIGLFELNQDGSLVIDANGNPIPTYDNSDIGEFAKVFTGLGPAEYYWHFEDFSFVPVQWGDPNNTVPTINMVLPMQMFEEWHEPGEKFLLNDQVIPAGQTGLEDISDALDNLFNHPNVGPFIGKQLIQRLVKSNPTPAYIERISEVFADNGNGVRGDMRAVVKAILLDPEARDCEWIAFDASGKMREPMVRYTQTMRAFNAHNESEKLWNIAALFEFACKQHVLSSPSVFNFFLPSHAPHGPIFDAGLVAPEFEILTSASAMNYINMVYFWFLADYYMEVTTLPSQVAIGFPESNIEMLDPDDLVSLDLTEELALAGQMSDLLDRLDILLTGGNLSDESKQVIAETANTLALFDQTIAVKSAIFLTLISPDYVIQK
jgi:uncharacterized protein (DUF1800 family)